MFAAHCDHVKCHVGFVYFLTFVFFLKYEWYFSAVSVLGCCKTGKFVLTICIFGIERSDL
jgi:hypothetical protein